MRETSEGASNALLTHIGLGFGGFLRLRVKYMLEVWLSKVTPANPSIAPATRSNKHHYLQGHRRTFSSNVAAKTFSARTHFRCRKTAALFHLMHIPNNGVSVLYRHLSALAIFGVQVWNPSNHADLKSWQELKNSSQKTLFHSARLLLSSLEKQG